MSARFSSRWWPVATAPAIGLLLLAWMTFELRMANQESPGSASASSSGAGQPLPAKADCKSNDDENRPDGPYAPLVSFPVAGARDPEVDIADEEFVLGVELRGHARAYPLGMLNTPRRHVLNDSLGGQPIAVTWCGISQSPIVFNRRVADKDLEFFVTGEIYSENLLLRDTETGSDWPQLSGMAISGPLKGKALTRLPSVWTDWKTWRREHPHTTILKLAKATDDMRHHSAYSASFVERSYFSTFQWGLARDGKALSWPFPMLARKAVVNDSLGDLSLVVVFDAGSSTVTAFDRRDGDRMLVFHATKDGLADVATGSLWNPITGKATLGALAGHRLTPLPGIVSQIRAWRIFHPESETRESKPG